MAFKSTIRGFIVIMFVFIYVQVIGMFTYLAARQPLIGWFTDQVLSRILDQQPCNQTATSWMIHLTSMQPDSHLWMVYQPLVESFISLKLLDGSLVVMKHFL